MIPRGIRNNNPGNIRELAGDTTNWVGERTTDDDKSFEEFQHAYYGIRALAVVLRTYQRKYGLKTTRQLINRWAPPNENDTSAYVSMVARWLQLDPDAFVDLSKVDRLMAMASAIMAHENGVIPGTSSYWSSGYPYDLVRAACEAAITNQIFTSNVANEKWPLEITERGIAIRLDKVKESGTQPPAPVVDLNPPPTAVKEETVVSKPVKEKTMGPWVVPAIQAASSFIPELVRLFGSGSRVSERNAKAAEVAVQMMQEVTQASNPVDAVEQLRADPAKLAEYRIMLQDQWAQLWGMVKEAEELEQAGMQKAAERMQAYETWREAIPFLLVACAQFLLTFIVMSSLGFLLYQAIQKSPDGELPEWAMIVMGSLLIVIALEWRSILQYVVGTTQGSSAKNSIISKLTKS